MAKVTLRDVSKYYDQYAIVNQVNLSIHEGEFIAIVGPSGSGKSTLLRLVSGLEPVSSGQILINDQCVNDINPSERDIAMVFQNYALYPHMTVYENMAYGLRMRGMKKDMIQARVNEVANLVQLRDYLHRKPGALSGGQRQRVAMARAIVRSPSLFLFDEPLSNLDATLRTDMRHEIKKLHRQLNTTSLYVTHDQTEAMTLADRVVVINQGRIEQIGTPQALYQTPASTFVARFIGHYPMNFLKATVDKKQRRVLCDLGVVLDVPLWDSSLRDGQALLVAVRSEHWRLVPSAHPNAIEARIEWIDDMGADKIIQVQSVKGNVPLLLRVPADTVFTEPTMGLEINYEKINLYCQQTGLRIGACHG